MRLAALGNSHLGCLKNAWDRIGAEFPSRQIVFFGVRGDELQHLRPEGTRLIPTHRQVVESIEFTSGGRKEIDLSEFDAALIYGCDIEPFIMPERFYSRQAITRTMKDVGAGLGYDLLKKAREVTDIPIYLGHEAFLAATTTPREESLEPYLKGLDAFNAAMLEPVGARMIGQPVETIVGGAWTELKYTRGSRRLAVGHHTDDELHPDIDLYHMNDLYGELWLRQFFELIPAGRASVKAERRSQLSILPALLSRLGGKRRESLL